MTNRWQQTDQIQMALQSAEIRMPGLESERFLHLTCKLVNIARGSCILEIHPLAANSKQHGTIKILIDRPMMQAELYVRETRFIQFIDGVTRCGNRPLNITLTIAEQLAVSIEGDLTINEEVSVPINDMAMHIPLK